MLLNSDLYVMDQTIFVKDGSGSISQLSIPENEKARLISAVQVRARTESRDSFRIEFDGDFYRVSVFNSLNGPFYILRKNPSKLIDFNKLGLPSLFKSNLLEIDKGMILFAGDVGSGKTTSCGSLIGQIMNDHGGILLTAEDPIELPLTGPIGKGYGFQNDSGEHELGFEKALRTAVRCSPDLLFVGEIRDAFTVDNALRASVNGLKSISTIHSESIIGTFFRLKALSQSMSSVGNLDALIAESIAAIVFVKRFEFVGSWKSSFQMLRIDNDKSVKHLIRTGDYTKLVNPIDQFSGRAGSM